jgi:acyl-CoA synthetase (NDP forming)
MGSREDKQYLSDLDILFNPRNIAFIGASNNIMKWGFIILDNLIDGGYTGEIYPVTLKEKKILGRKCYQSIKDIGVPIDMAMIVIPAERVADTLRDCIEAGVKSVVVVTSGFSEAGEDGREIEKRIAEIAHAARMPMVGPNTMGVYGSGPSMCAMMAPLTPKPGEIAFVAQSGNLGTQIMGLGRTRGIGFSKFASSGNEALLHCENYIEYFGKDPDSKVIIAYIEGLADGSEFMQVAREVTRRKPLIVFKGGRSEAGSRAAKSHTGVLAGSGKIYDAAFRQVGAIQAATPDEMLDIGLAMSELPLPAGNRIGIITWGGGWGVVAADACEKAGLKVPQLSEQTIKTIDGILPPYWSRNNPIDLVSTMDRPAHIKCLEALASDTNIDAIIALSIVGTVNFLFNVPSTGEKKIPEEYMPVFEYFKKQDELIEKKVKELIEKYKKPIVGVSVDPLYDFNPDRSGGMVIFTTPHRAVDVIARMVEYKQYLDSLEE